MALIILNNDRPAIASDMWTYVADDEALPEAAPAILSLERWTADRASLAGRNAPVGVRLRSDQRIDALLGDLDSVPAIALDFPNLGDGRHFTTARLLRERHGYRGEIRATGQVLRDQFLFMHRCGFDAFEVKSADMLEAWHKAMGELSLSYQPAADDRIPVYLLRRRRARETAGAVSRPGESEQAPRAACCAGDWAY